MKITVCNFYVVIVFNNLNYIRFNEFENNISYPENHIFITQLIC